MRTGGDQVGGGYIGGSSNNCFVPFDRGFLYRKFAYPDKALSTAIDKELGRTDGKYYTVEYGNTELVPEELRGQTAICAIGDTKSMPLLFVK